MTKDQKAYREPGKHYRKIKSRNQSETSKYTLNLFEPCHIKKFEIPLYELLTCCITYFYNISIFIYYLYHIKCKIDFWIKLKHKKLVFSFTKNLLKTKFQTVYTSINSCTGKLNLILYFRHRIFGYTNTSVSCYFHSVLVLCSCNIPIVKGNTMM